MNIVKKEGRLESTHLFFLKNCLKNPALEDSQLGSAWSQNPGMKGRYCQLWSDCLT